MLLSIAVGVLTLVVSVIVLSLPARRPKPQAPPRDVYRATWPDLHDDPNPRPRYRAWWR